MKSMKTAKKICDLCEMSCEPVHIVKKMSIVHIRAHLGLIRKLGKGPDN
jgi:hypothetical protein